MIVKETVELVEELFAIPGALWVVLITEHGEFALVPS